MEVLFATQKDDGKSPGHWKVDRTPREVTKPHGKLMEVDGRSPGCTKS